MHSRLYQDPNRSSSVATQYHSVLGKFLATHEAVSPAASFTLQHLNAYIEALEEANLGPSGISKHLGGLATIAECLALTDTQNAAT